MIDFIGNDIEKNTLYKNEIPYRMVCNMIKMYWPHQYKEELRKYGLMLIKPEAIIMGKAYLTDIIHRTEYNTHDLIHILSVLHFDNFYCLSACI